MSIAMAHNLEKMWLSASEILAFYVVLFYFRKIFHRQKTVEKINKREEVNIEIIFDYFKEFLHLRKICF